MKGLLGDVKSRSLYEEPPAECTAPSSQPPEPLGLFPRWEQVCALDLPAPP